MPHLPPPPYRVRPALFVRSAAGVVLAGAFGCLMAWLLLALLPAQTASLLRERAVWERGTPAAEATFDGQVKSNRFIFREYELDVAYTDAQGAAHTGKLEFSTLGASMGEEGAEEVRYDPNAPESFALKGAIDVTGGRWAHIVFFGIASLAIVVGAAFSIVHIFRHVGRIRRCARDGRLVEVELVGVATTDQHGNTTYKFRPLDARFEQKSKAATFGRAFGAIHLGGDTTRALALASATDEDALVLLRSDLYPFRFDPLEAARVANEAHACRGHDPAPYR